MNYTNNTIEELLAKYKALISDDFDRYKNHVYRVYLNCLLIDSDNINREKYAVAAVFHDIGIWTESTFDYLEPSENETSLYLKENGRQEWIEEITSMIHFHHKLSRYRGSYEKTVESFRKADWIDISIRINQFWKGHTSYQQYEEQIPESWFPFFSFEGNVKEFFKTSA